jgi:hypothetical protein
MTFPSSARELRISISVEVSPAKCASIWSRFPRLLLFCSIWSTALAR